jgi:hypothetical protein
MQQHHQQQTGSNQFKPVQDNITEMTPKLTAQQILQQQGPML